MLYPQNDDRFVAINSVTAARRANACNATLLAYVVAERKSCFDTNYGKPSEFQKNSFILVRAMTSTVQPSTPYRKSKSDIFFILREFAF